MKSSWWIWNRNTIRVGYRSHCRGWQRIGNLVLVLLAKATNFCHTKVTVSNMICWFPPYHRYSKWHTLAFSLIPLSQMFRTMLAKLHEVPKACPGHLVCNQNKLNNIS